jgi:hypothetical protein
MHGAPLAREPSDTVVKSKATTLGGRNLPSRFQQLAETPWWGLGRFVFAQRVKDFWAVGSASIPVKREIYPTWLEHSE